MVKPAFAGFFCFKIIRYVSFLLICYCPEIVKPNFFRTVANKSFLSEGYRET